MSSDYELCHYDPSLRLHITKNSRKKNREAKTKRAEFTITEHKEFNRNGMCMIKTTKPTSRKQLIFLTIIDFNLLDLPSLFSS